METTPFDGTWAVISSPDFESKDLAGEVAPYLRLRQVSSRVRGDYQMGLLTGEIDGQLDGPDRVLFSFEGMDELEEANGRGTLTLNGDHLTLALMYHQGDTFTFLCERER